MTKLDQALANLQANPQDPQAQMGFYDLFLNSIFFVPISREIIADDAAGDEKGAGEKKLELPLIIDHEGSDFLVFFDEQKRLTAWAGEEVPCAQMPGIALVEISSPGVSWALNVGSEHDKQFPPEEIAWLQGVVARSRA